AEQYLTANIDKLKSRSILDRTIRGSALLLWLYQNYVQFKAGVAQKHQTAKPAEDKLTGLNTIPVDIQVVLKDYPPVWQDAWKIEEKLILDTNQQVKDSGSKFLLVSSA